MTSCVTYSSYLEEVTNFCYNLQILEIVQSCIYRIFGVVGTSKNINPPLGGLGLWELCSKFLSLFYFKFLLKPLYYAQFYATDSMIILHL